MNLTPVFPRSAPALKSAFSKLGQQEIVSLAQYAADYPDTVPLWFGESDVVTSEIIRSSAVRALEAGETFYPDVRGLAPLRVALADYSSRLSGTTVVPDRIMVTASGMAALNLSLNAVTESGDEAIIVGPVWPNAYGVLTLSGVTPVEIALDFDPDSGWALDLDRIRAAITPKTRLLFVNSPGNPTGWIGDRETLRALIDLSRQHGFWIIADEVYNRIDFDEDPAPSFLELTEPDDALIVLNSFSKTWSMTGWRMGWLTAPSETINQLALAMEYLTSGVSTFSQHACLTAIDHVEDIASSFRAYCLRGRTLIGEVLGDLDRVRYAPPKGGFYAFFEVEGVTDSVSEAQRLVREHGVGLAPGRAFGERYDSWFRLCFAQSPQTIARAARRLEDGLK